jgi:ORMDL family
MVLASDVHGQPIVGRQTSVSQMQTAGINKNTSWLSSTGAWAFYAGLIIFGWLVLSLFMDGGFAWTWIHLIHGIVTFYLLHWMKVCHISSLSTARRSLH